MTEPRTCKNCGRRIVLVNFALGEQWVHQPVGSAFQDNMERYCQTKVAEPRDD